MYCSPGHKRVEIDEARCSHESAVAVRGAGDPRMLILHTYHGVLDVRGEGFQRGTDRSKGPVEIRHVSGILDSCTYIHRQRIFNTHIVCICVLSARSCTPWPVHAWKHELRVYVRISIHFATLPMRRMFRCTTDGYSSCEMVFTSTGSFSRTLDSSLVAVIGGLCISWSWV